jgi:hypothetical protein
MGDAVEPSTLLGDSGDEQRAREAFRVAQFGGAHPAWGAAAAAEAKDDHAKSGNSHACTAYTLSSSIAEPTVAPDATRVIVHVDVDCFYAQVEEHRHPALAGKPLAVTQK